jgi:hypothetical protein
MKDENLHFKLHTSSFTLQTSIDGDHGDLFITGYRGYKSRL